MRGLDHLRRQLEDAWTLLRWAESEPIASLLEELDACLKTAEEGIAQFEFQKMFSGKMDASSAFIDLQAGSGGVEAQDWAQMLLRMYARWGEQNGLTVELIDRMDGEVAGIKSATLHLIGPYAYGWLRTETGTHRLVRKSPFDANHKRHTSFASVFVYPEVNDQIEIQINPSDLRIDTYRAGGAGGQHVNRTDSAVRITHLPTGTVVQSQCDRSQHQNKAKAMNQLKAKLFELELRKRNEEKQALESTKSDITWGSQIRSYVLDQSRVKDLRTDYESSNPEAVLDGDLTPFLTATLQQVGADS